MKLKLFISIICAGVILPVFAQGTTALKKVKVGTPVLLKPNEEGTYKASELAKTFQPGSKWGREKMSKTYWHAWSDRDNNIVYADANSNQEAKRKLDFGERVTIGDIVGDRAYVYIDSDEKNDNYPNVSSRAKMIGWVPLDNLLLWDRCPTDDLGVQQKALIAIHINDLKVNGKYEKAYYRHPVDHSNPLSLSMTMEFYFIMKNTMDKKALLCKNPTLMGNGGNLIGWVDAAYYTPWGQRGCLETNWDINYVERNKGREVGIYNQSSLNSGSILKIKYGHPNDDGDHTQQYRMEPQLLRFPILSSIGRDDKFIHCTAFANYDTRNLEGYDTKVDVSVDEKRQKKRQMNLIFVMEAMPGMGDYFDAVKESLTKCNMYNDKGLTVQAGLVLYRNEGASNMIETAHLANVDDAKLTAMLSSKTLGKWIGKNRSVALRQAIEKAVDPTVMGFSTDHSNLLIIIGNNGGDESDTLSESSLIKRLADNHIQIMSIQTVTSGTGSPAIYNDQVVKLLMSNMDKQYKDMKDKYKFSRFPDFDGYYFKSEKKSENVVFSELRYPAEDGGKLTSQLASKYVNNGVNRFAQTIANWSKYFEKSLSSGFDEAFLESFLGENLFRDWKKNNDISAFDGYAPVKDVDDENYWHYIVYLSNDELHDLLDRLKPTYLAAKEKSDDRKAYIEAMRTLAQHLTGQSKDKEIEKMSINDLQSLIYGLNIHTEATSRKLEEIKDPSRVKKAEYQKILNNFVNKYESLKQLFQSNYRYRAKYGDDYYYWIPIEELP